VRVEPFRTLSGLGIAQVLLSRFHNDDGDQVLTVSPTASRMQGDQAH
jgi:hypothetical protein